jgi:transcriptional regulator with XRE-family HTH domain
VKRNIKTKRNDLRLSLVEISLAAGVSQGRLSYIERGIVEPTPDERERIEGALASLTRQQFMRAAYYLTGVTA